MTHKHKDAAPEATVEKLISLLAPLGLELEETWADENELGTFSLRLSVKGSTIGSNGKGLTRAYARASAYAEFMERLQNNKLAANTSFNHVLWEHKAEHVLFRDETFLTPEAMEDNAFLRFFRATRGPGEPGTLPELLRQYHKLDYNIHRRENEFLCLPYNSLREQKLVYLPYTLVNQCYGSNGMCAGNTPEEALVQGLSEIFERRVQTELILHSRALPDVPEEYIARFPEIFRMYETVKQNEKFTIFLKDGSLGGRYPVCVLVVAEKDTGRFGVKLGSHPDYRIAMERLFTEATQGIDLDLFAQKSFFNFANTGVATNLNLQNGFKTGDAAYPYQLFLEQGEWDFVPPADVSGASNRQLLDRCLEILKREGKDVLIRDVSFLGFPSFHIVVPGFSEMNVPTRNDFEADNTRFHLQRLLRTPERITEENAPYLISVIGYYQHALQSNSFRDFSGTMQPEKYHGFAYGADLLYFKAMVYVFLGDWENAKAVLDLIGQIMRLNGQPSEEKAFLLAVDQYLGGRCAGREHQEVLGCLRRLFRPEITEEIDRCFQNRKAVLTSQYRSVPDEELPEDYRTLVRITEDYIAHQRDKDGRSCDGGAE